MTEDQGRDRLAGWRDGAFADLATIIIGLAASTNPEELRKALGSIFDLKHYEAELKQVHAEARQSAAMVDQVRELLYQINLDLERIERRQDAIEERQERHEKSLASKG